MKAIEKELTVRSAQKKGPVNKYANVKGKLRDTMISKPSDKKMLELLEQIRMKLTENERLVIALTAKRDQVCTKSNFGTGSQISKDIERMMEEISEVSNRIASIKSEGTRDKQLFEDSSDFIK